MNSFAMVCEKLSMMANNIKKQMEDDSDFPIEIIKQPELQDFKMDTAISQNFIKIGLKTKEFF